MDPEIVQGIRAANEACITLITLMIMDDTRETAVELVASDPLYSDAATTLAFATLAVSTIRTLARELGVEPLELVQIAGLSAATHEIELEREIEGE